MDSKPKARPPARPFLKWPGGKTALLPELLKRVPPGFCGTYYEPFVGAGALFFALQPAKAVLADANQRLIRTYRAIAEDCAEVIKQLTCHSVSHDKGYFLEMRAQDVDAMTDTDVAAWMIYLNKTCFNGLYRVNRSGKFNSPMGKFASPPTICDTPNLRACSAALQNVTLECRDFRDTVADAKKGDLVYFDPPYFPATATANFSSYTADGFTYRDQIALLDTAKDLKRRGVHVILTNSATLATESIYDDGNFTLDRVEVRRGINSKGSGRGPVGEYIIT